jgi:hypothetical protein
MAAPLVLIPAVHAFIMIQTNVKSVTTSKTGNSLELIVFVTITSFLIREIPKTFVKVVTSRA